MRIAQFFNPFEKCTKDNRLTYRQSFIFTCVNNLKNSFQIMKIKFNILTHLTKTNQNDYGRYKYMK